MPKKQNNKVNKGEEYVTRVFGVFDPRDYCHKRMAKAYNDGYTSGLKLGERRWRKGGSS